MSDPPSGLEPHEPDYDELRRQGLKAAAEAVASGAPTDELERIAWAMGFREVDLVRVAVAQARARRIRWQSIADVLGLKIDTARAKFGTGQERWKRWDAKKKGTDD